MVMAPQTKLKKKSLPNQTKSFSTKPKSKEMYQKRKKTKLDLTKYLKRFEMSKSAAQLLYAPVLVLIKATIQ